MAEIPFSKKMSFEKTGQSYKYMLITYKNYIVGVK